MGRLYAFHSQTLIIPVVADNIFQKHKPQDMEVVASGMYPGLNLVSGQPNSLMDTIDYQKAFAGEKEILEFLTYRDVGDEVMQAVLQRLRKNHLHQDLGR